MKRAPRGTGSARTRPGKRPEVRVWIGGERRSFSGKTVTEARQRANEARRTEVVTSKQGPTLRDWLIVWLERNRDSVAAQTWLSYEQQCRDHIIPYLGHLRLSEITAQDVEQWHDALSAAHLSPGSVSNVHTALSAALGVARKRGHKVSNALAMVGRPRRRQQEIETLSREDAMCLVQHLEGNPLEAAFILALTVGMRGGELRGLQWKDVDLDRGSIRIRSNATRDLAGGHVLKQPKTESGSRTIAPLPQIALEALQRTERRGELVFPGVDGKPMPGSTFFKRWARIRADAGISEVSIHALRHTAATHALEDGISPHVVANMLGHASVATTLRLYAHVTRVSSEAVARAIDARYEQRAKA